VILLSIASFAGLLLRVNTGGAKKTPKKKAKEHRIRTNRNEFFHGKKRHQDSMAQEMELEPKERLRKKVRANTCESPLK